MLKPHFLLVMTAAAAALGSTPAQADELANLINAYRAAPDGCSGALPAPALTPEPALSQLRVHTGTFLEPALRGLGYRADRAEAITVSGAPDAQAALEVLQRKYCARLVNPAFSAIGTARSGNEWQVVLAHPLVFPELPGWEDAGRQVLLEVNLARAKARSCGQQQYPAVPPLAWNERLAQAALGHSTNMAEGHYFSHVEKDGSDPAARATRAGYVWRAVGENIVSGYSTPKEAVAAWLDSPGHCANIMNPNYTETGVAYAINPASENRTVYWTQAFARPR
jgi:uncharacterized protein YkwD